MGTTTKKSTITKRCGKCHGPAKTYGPVTVCATMRCGKVTKEVRAL